MAALYVSFLEERLLTRPVPPDAAPDEPVQL